MILLLILDVFLAVLTLGSLYVVHRRLHRIEERLATRIADTAAKDGVAAMEEAEAKVFAAESREEFEARTNPAVGKPAS